MTIETNPNLLQVEIHGNLLDWLNILYYLSFRTQRGWIERDRKETVGRNCLKKAGEVI